MPPALLLPRRVALAAPALLLAPRRALAARDAAVLVFGLSDYRNLTPLANPRRDAEAVAATFQAMGAGTELVIDATRARMAAALSRFAGRASRAPLAVVFFAGHGIQRRDENWLVPVDADPNSAQDVPATMIPLAEVIRSSARAGQRVVVLDACRDDPFADSPATGLARVEDAGAGTLVAFATSPGRVALDGRGRHSPFADALLDHLGTPGLDLRQVLTRVRRRVLVATDGQQVPWDTSSLTADVVLRDPGLPPVGRPAPPTVAAARQQPQPQQQASPPPPRPVVVAQGDVAFDAARYREIPQTYARARAAAHPLPDGLLVQRRNIEGRETPLTGSYIWGNDGGLLVLIGYNEEAGRASMILSSNATNPRAEAFWRQSGGIVSGGVIRLIHNLNNSTLISLDTRSGWGHVLSRRDRSGSLVPAFQIRFTRIE